MEEIRSPMAGKVWKVECKVGERVQADDVVIILEAMKMETELFAPAAGAVKEIRVKEGDSVEEDDILLIIST
ncbi:MAG: acyl-CoA carboxylase biotin carboxyl carrier protein subunit [Deferrisomatales bacterium]